MHSAMKIDFVSDISCPWCALGLQSLNAALAKLDGEVKVELYFQPFELNPQMGPEGENAIEHLVAKLRTSAEQIERNQQALITRGAELGFVFDMQKRERIYNTFDAHRLLHWANTQGKQRELKQALFAAYFTEGRNISDHEVLLELAINAGLDVARAKQILSTNEFSKEVREREQFYSSHGIHGVPAVIINDQHLIEGAQPVDVFERALRQITVESGR
jgi:predicted DsbA family dithiol-disulfide isomerase